nr:integrase, catalytic region, zinc finger, CCHC-type, peptidase aspartic, catalytic [Tanacetum cinerariifolium]
MILVSQIDIFYNGLTLRHRDTIDAAAGETFMKRRLEECYDLIENMTAHHNDWDTSAQQSVILAIHSLQSKGINLMDFIQKKVDNGKNTSFWDDSWLGDVALKNDREDIGKLGAKGDIGFCIGYSVDSCAYRIYNRRTKKIMETMNVSFDELLTMDFEQRSLKPGLQSMTSGQISSRLDLTYAPSTITTQQPTEVELDLLFEAMYDDYIGGQPSAAQRTVMAAQAQQFCQTSTTSTSIAETAPTLTNSSSHATNFPISSQDVDELNLQQQHVQQQGNQAHLQSATAADNVSNAMFDANTFVNPFENSSTSDAESSSSQNVDPSNMHMFYQPYSHKFQWSKDHPLEQVIREPSRHVLIRNQLRSDGDMCMYALAVSTIEPKTVKEAMTDPAWIESMQEELL